MSPKTHGTPDIRVYGLGSLSKPTSRDYSDLQQLDRQLHPEGPYPLYADFKTYVDTMVSSDTVHAFTARDGGHHLPIIGFITLTVIPTLGEIKGWVDDAVVDERYREHGVAKTLSKEAIMRAKYLGVKALIGTSNENRTEAQSLWEKLGAYQPDTIFLRKDL